MTNSEPSLQWDDVRYFLALSRQGSLSAAARALGVEHSTVSRRVGQLEATLRLRLFDRLPRGWVPTAEGQRLIAGAQALEAEMLAFERDASSARGGLRGTVRLSVPPLLLQHVLMPLLAPWPTLYPEIALDLVGENRQSRLAQGEAEIALRLAAPTDEGLIARPLAEVGYALYTARERPLPAPPEQVFIGFDRSMGDLPKRAWMDAHAAGRRMALRSNDFVAMQQAARAGWGIAMLPRFLGQADPLLMPVPGAPAVPSQPLYLMMHPGLRRSERVQAMVRFLVQAFDARAPELA